MNKRPQPVSITILGKEYKIACEEEEKDTLIRSAQDLDKKMRAIRDTGKVNSPDRIAVMAALNLAHELRQLQNMSQNPSKSLGEKLLKLRHKIENVLEIP
ncbi:cell division protein ZapA [Methylomarinum sp. Ch1-1]|uniref:Cell division protein ZapA n=1 Tax=Methylomarinum roseum TaxID=3067653 RepID=A0AAU7NWX8_9GAMM|nr:cell division protein ZapA [Methylomarinum sp. Ch1-1]MDP4522458.1 cell division protein ZapA [Methylomarinum sp. Ch1-1]